MNGNNQNDKTQQIFSYCEKIRKGEQPDGMENFLALVHDVIEEIREYDNQTRNLLQPQINDIERGFDIVYSSDLPANTKNELFNIFWESLMKAEEMFSWGRLDALDEMEGQRQNQQPEGVTEE